MKKLMLLGGSKCLIPVIETARQMGCYIITCDYLPDNYAHPYGDEYCNISVVDKEKVLEAARNLEVDGIMSFACDAGVTTAAYVAEKMGLPSVGSYDAVSILQNKGKFREFLKEHGFNVPVAKCYKKMEEVLRDIGMFRWPVIVKPVDSAGSKGVTRIENPENLKQGIDRALRFSCSKEFIVEEFLEQVGQSSDSDAFSVDGNLEFISFSRQYFDDKAENPYAPAAYGWPSSISNKHQKELFSEIQRLISLLNLGTSVYNIEARVCKDGKVYIMEVSPRGGGNRLAEMVRYMTGEDMIFGAVKAALGEPFEINQKTCDGFWAEIILHSNQTGIFERLCIADSIEKNIIECDVWVKEGDEIRAFSCGGDAMGTLILKFDSKEKMNEVLENQEKYIRIILQEKFEAE